MIFKLDDATGNLIDLSQYQPRGDVFIPEDEFGMKGGGQFTIYFNYRPELWLQLASIHEAESREFQTYESQKCGERIAGECVLVDLNADDDEIAATFEQTGPQVLERISLTK